jgi:hypothetical protein
MLGMVSRSLLLTAVILFTVTAIKHAPAVWRGPPQMLVALDPETRDWVKDLKNRVGGPCCDTADGFPVEVDRQVLTQFDPLRNPGGSL